jgi:cytochrome bd-type quinol oxidase subunit 1
MEYFKVFGDLFTSLIGLLSLFTIAFIIGMGFFFARYFKDRIAEDERNSARQQRERGAKA